MYGRKLVFVPYWYQNSWMSIERLIYNPVMYSVFLLHSHSTSRRIPAASVVCTPTPSHVKDVR